MVGYGPEDCHFVVELTYNYGLGSYKLGTDFRVSNVCRVQIAYYIDAQTRACLYYNYTCPYGHLEKENE